MDISSMLAMGTMIEADIANKSVTKYLNVLFCIYLPLTLCELEGLALDI